MLVTGDLAAKRVYSYRDEQGIRHFTDKPPDTDQPVHSRLAKADPKKWIEALEDGTAEDKRYLLVNQMAGPVEVEMYFNVASNVLSAPALPARAVVPGLSSQPILKVIPEDPTRSWSFNFQFRWMLGDPNAKPDPNARYRLPFRLGEQHPLMQGFGGPFSHSHEQSYFAIDIAMDEGTPVLASRSGTVMLVEDDFFGAGTDIGQWGDRANHVRILHADGTMAVYAHLELETIEVEVGDKVRAGQQIARSGNTGFSTGPHLHFVVQRNTGMRLTSVPFKFDEHPELDPLIEGTMLGKMPESTTDSETALGAGGE